MKFCTCVRYPLISKVALFLFLVLSSIITTHTTAESTWWHNDWSGRVPLTLNGSTLGSSLEQIPVLVVLNPSRVDYRSGAADGRDLRFVADDHATILPHEIERWVSGGTSYLWVRVPSVQGQGSTRI